jgi:plastocyanin
VSFDTVTGTNNSLSSGPIAPGEKFMFTFTSPGTYPYYCIYHPWMKGTVTVVKQ